ncbi:hypothetical protein KC968_02755 [Candidatus Saccharibacteria bacterium]|nr:hypothetical protein [Candidatus Saccharibacteria bacterium]
MEKSIFNNELSLNQEPHKANQGLDDQSFFHAPEQPDESVSNTATKFIMSRMMQVQ